MKLELTEGDSLEVSDDTPMYDPHIIPLTDMNMLTDFLNYVFLFTIK